jgi:hypothetical protein
MVGFPRKEGRSPDLRWAKVARPAALNEGINIPTLGTVRMS